MNSLKTLFICVILAAVAYGVYVSISRNPETVGLPDKAPLWPGSDASQNADPNAAAPQFGPGGPADSMTWNDRAAPQFPSTQPGTMPAASPTAMNPGTMPGANPTPMSPAAVGGGNTAAPQFTMPQNPPTPVDAGSPGMASPYPSTDRYAAQGGMQSPAASAGMDLAPPNQDFAGGTTPSPPGQLNGLGPASSARPGTAPPGGAADTFSVYMQEVQGKLDQSRLREALQTLTRWYGDPSLSPQQARQVTELLDKLAGTVVYSREHWLEDPYIVRVGDTAEQIAQQYSVPWQVLARINGVSDAQQPRPGQTLKVVRGPFHARIDLSKYELTLMLGDLYAGRFPIGIGSDQARLDGTYVVSNMTRNPEYFGPDNVRIYADDPSNPLGEYWISLAQEAGQASPIGIHGTNDPANLRRTGGRGSICLGQKDIDDVFGILSLGSRVTVTGGRYQQEARVPQANSLGY